MLRDDLIIRLSAAYIQSSVFERNLEAGWDAAKMAADICQFADAIIAEKDKKLATRR